MTVGANTAFAAAWTIFVWMWTKDWWVSHDGLKESKSIWKWRKWMYVLSIKMFCRIKFSFYSKDFYLGLVRILFEQITSLENFAKDVTSIDNCNWFKHSFFYSKWWRKSSWIFLHNKGWWENQKETNSFPCWIHRWKIMKRCWLCYELIHFVFSFLRSISDSFVITI